MLLTPDYHNTIVEGNPVVENRVGAVTSTPSGKVGWFIIFPNRPSFPHLARGLARTLRAGPEEIAFKEEKSRSL